MYNFYYTFSRRKMYIIGKIIAFRVQHENKVQFEVVDQNLCMHKVRHSIKLDMKLCYKVVH